VSNRPLFRPKNKGNYLGNYKGMMTFQTIFEECVGVFYRRFG